MANERYHPNISHHALSPTVHYEIADSVVINIDRKQWYAGTMHREMDIEVYCEKYNINETLHERASGMIAPDHWDCKEDDIVQVEIVYWKDYNGNVISREISHLK